jgi:hypothetical protein
VGARFALVKAARKISSLMLHEKLKEAGEAKRE